jgi:uncharacterized protein YdeI (BOF family)
MRTAARSLLVSMAALALAAPAVAQAKELPTTTISVIERGEAPPLVYLEGAALEQTGDDEYLFSDGTGVITIDVAPALAEGELPLFELIGVEGAISNEVLVASRWAPLPIMTPAVIVEEPQVIEAFWGWIIAYGSQAPTPAE